MESQNIEYKESWRDEYLKWICGFANAQGGTLYIGNDCVFPANWTKETLMGKHRSLPYNPNIARGFFWAGYIETWGRGIEKICDACDAYGSPRPEYTVYPEDIMVMFKAKEMPKTVPVADGDDVEKRPETTEKTTEKIINCIENNPQITTAELSKYCNLTVDGINWQLRQMKQKGLIRRVGPDKGGHWEIVKPKEK